MAFPTTGLLDDFNRTDATDLGANWTDSISGTPATGWRIVSNRARMDDTNLFESAYWDVAQYGPDCECYYTVVHTPGSTNRVMMYFQITVPGATPTFYLLKWGSSADATLHGFEKTVAGVNSVIGADWNESLAAGDTLGVEKIGNFMQAKRKPSAGSWANSGTAHTDSSISAAGYLGIETRDSTPTFALLDDFSGGTIVGVTPSVNPDFSQFPRYLLAGRATV